MAYHCCNPECDRFFNSKLGRAVFERIVHGESYSERKTDFLCSYCEKNVYFTTELGFQVHLGEFQGVPSKTLKWVERRSFENLVHIYSDELTKVKSENGIAGFLDEHEKSRLLKEGVLLIEEYGRMGKSTLYRLSDEALDVVIELERYKNDKIET